MLTSDLQVHRHTCAHLQIRVHPHKHTCNVGWTQRIGRVGIEFEKESKQGQGQLPRDPPHPGDTSLADHQLLASFVYSKPYYFWHTGSAFVSGLVLIPVGVRTGVGTLEREDPVTPSLGTDHLGELCVGQPFP